MFTNVTKCEQVDTFFKNVLTNDLKPELTKIIEINSFLKCINLHKYTQLLPNIFDWLNEYSDFIFKYSSTQPDLNDILSVIFLYKKIEDSNFFNMLTNKVKTNIFGSLFIEYQVQLSSDRYNNDIILKNLKYILENYCDDINICKALDDNESLDDFVILLSITNIKNSCVCIDILHQLYCTVYDGITKEHLSEVLHEKFNTKHRIISNPILYGIYKRLISKRRINNG